MQTILDKTINIISSGVYTTSKDEFYQNLPQTACLQPFYSNDNRYIAFWCVTEPEFGERFGYRLHVKDMYTDHTYSVTNFLDTSEFMGFHPIIENQSSNRMKYSASFSPDSKKLLFLTSDRSFIVSNEIDDSEVDDGIYRWISWSIDTGIYHKVGQYQTTYGNFSDFHEALWIDKNSIAFVSYSDNLIPNTPSSINHSEVYVKNIAIDTIQHVSRKEDGNLSPYFINSSYDITVSENKISFYNIEIGYAIKDLITSDLIIVNELAGMISSGITTPELFGWSNDGTKFLFKITSTGNTISEDINNQTDDFIYDLTNDIITPINSNVNLFGDGYSVNSVFSPNDMFVAFLSNSTNFGSSNGTVNLYIKEISTGIISRISKSINDGDIDDDILGFNWLTNDRLVFTTKANNIINGDINTDIDWFVYDVSIDTSKRINFNDMSIFTSTNILKRSFTDLDWLLPNSSNIQSITNHDDNITYSINNEFSKNIRRNTFNIDGNVILFSGKLPNISEFIVAGMNGYNIFSKTIDDIELEFTTGNVYPEPNDAINAIVKNKYNTDLYTNRDNITGNDTLAVIGSQYIERVNSIQYRNIDSDIRWMRISYPMLPLNISQMKIGAGIFKSSPTLLDDIIDVKQNNVITTQNPVIGILTSFAVTSYRDIAIISAGDDISGIEDVTIYLEATVYGNMSGHTFTWEQMYGDPINLIQTSDTQAYYLNNGIMSDTRTFRFWVDKNASVDHPNAYNGRLYEDINITNIANQRLIYRTQDNLLYFVNGKYVHAVPGAFVPPVERIISMESIFDETSAEISPMNVSTFDVISLGYDFMGYSDGTLKYYGVDESNVLSRLFTSNVFQNFHGVQYIQNESAAIIFNNSTFNAQLGDVKFSISLGFANLDTVYSNTLYDGTDGELYPVIIGLSDFNDIDLDRTNTNQSYKGAYFSINDDGYFTCNTKSISTTSVLTGVRVNYTIEYNLFIYLSTTYVEFWIGIGNNSPYKLATITTNLPIYVNAGYYQTIGKSDYVCIDWIGLEQSINIQRNII